LFEQKWFDYLDAHRTGIVLKMRQFSDNFIKDYLQKVGLETIKKYGVYQIEGPGKRFV
jgi:predicted house-cleaning NTP pyrophosphatase (Maf/HAM1 superfamily)